MTLQDMFKLVDSLPKEDLEALQARINQRLEPKSKPLVPETDAELLEVLEDIFKDAEPIELKAGTMDVDKFAEAMRTIREGLTEEEREEIAEAMNAEYIESDKDV